MFATEELKKCPVCNRGFAPERLKVHENICKNVSTTNRKLFDPARQRFESDFLQQGKKAMEKKATKLGPSILSTNWRWKHNNFIQFLKNFKDKLGDKKDCHETSDIPLSPKLDCDAYIKCPNCMRQFNSASFERHISMCEKMMKSISQTKEDEEESTSLAVQEE